MNLSGATTPGQSGPRSDGKKGVPALPKAPVLQEPQYHMALRHI